MLPPKAIAIASIITLTLLGGACSRPVQQATVTNQPPVKVTIPRGVSLSPSATAANPFAEFFAQAEQAGSYISWGGNVTELAKANGAPAVLRQQTAQREQTPVFIVSPTAADLKSAATWEAWSDQVVAFARTSPPAFLGVGNEVNKSLSTADLRAFAGYFPTLVSDIHRVSPSTKVFVTLQLEWLKGMRGGLFGGKNDAAQNQWSSKDLAPFFTGDVVGFTSYPGLVYREPSDIPDDYYTDITSHVDVPVLFTELGWFRTGPTGWESSRDEQADFIARYFVLTASVQPVFSIWSFLYDPAAKAPFETMGLLKADETTSPAWEAWRSR